jgi:tetratricopeptide (TPR) repeat protein
MLIQHIRLKSLVAACSVLVVTTTAAAQDPAGAEVLFREGRRLLDEGNVEAACEKLKESQALDPMSGTLLNLADCLAKQGKTATAWARFRNAAELANTQGKADQAAEATRRAGALEADLSYLTIKVLQPVPDLEVKRGDISVGRGLFGVAVPVDPGRMRVVASAPGYKTVQMTVEIGPRRDRKIVTIPKLEQSTQSAAPRSSEPAAPTLPEDRSTTPPPDSGTSQGPGALPWVVGGVGAAALATGGVFGLLALRSNSDAQDLCPTRKGCSSAALDAADRRDQQAMIANLGVGVGVVGLGVATWLLLSSGHRSRPRAEAPALTVAASGGPGEVVVWTRGGF